MVFSKQKFFMICFLGSLCIALLGFGKLLPQDAAAQENPTLHGRVVGLSGSLLLELNGKEEMNAELVSSETWTELINHPRLKVWETGRLDSVLLGQGDRYYGKLHAKFIITGDIGFVGTSNFDYRSRLYNNEMGFFFYDPELIAEIARNTDYLISLSYRWGSPEWLAMRSALVEAGGVKGITTRQQSTLFRFLRATGLKWQF